MYPLDQPLFGLLFINSFQRRTNQFVIDRMTGRTVLAEEMHRHGLINYLYPKDSFIEKVTEFVSSFADKEPDRLQAIKQLTQLGAAGVTAAAQNKEKAALNNFYMSKEGQEKIQEFYKKSLEKRSER